MAALISRCNRCRQDGKKYFSKRSCSHAEAVWCVKYRVGKTQIFKTIGKLKRDAEDYAATVRTSLAVNGTFRAVKPMLFSELANHWFAVKARLNRPSTKYGYRLALDKVILPVLGHKVVSHMTPLDIESFTAALSETKAPGTVAKRVSLVKDIFRYGMQTGILKENPAQYVKTSSKKVIKDRFLTLAEAQRLLLLPAQPIRAMISLSLCLGLRLNEVTALRWSSIDFTKNRIAINQSVSRLPKSFTNAARSWIVDKPKTETSNAIMPLPVIVKDALQAWRVICSKGNITPIGFVFPGKSGGPVSGTCVHEHFQKALLEAKIEPMRYHDLRHSYGSLLITKHGEIHPKVLQALMRHSLIQTTLDVYGHLMPGVADQAALKIDEVLSDLFTTGILRQAQKQ